MSTRTTPEYIRKAAELLALSAPEFSEATLAEAVSGLALDERSEAQAAA